MIEFQRFINLTSIHICPHCEHRIDSTDELVFKNSNLGLCPACQEVFIVNDNPLATKDIKSMDEWISQNNPMVSADITVDFMLQTGYFLIGESLTIGFSLSSLVSIGSTSIIIKTISEDKCVFRVTASKADLPHDGDYGGMVIHGNTGLAWTYIKKVGFLPQCT